jgi:hypothetical protein
MQVASYLSGAKLMFLGARSMGFGRANTAGPLVGFF